MVNTVTQPKQLMATLKSELLEEKYIPLMSSEGNLTLFSDSCYSPFHHWSEEFKGATIYWALCMCHTCIVSFNHY